MKISRMSVLKLFIAVCLLCAGFVLSAEASEVFDPAWLSIEPAVIDFGEVAPDAGEIWETLRITNNSPTQSCVIDLWPEGYSETAMDCIDNHAELGPGEHYDFEILFISDCALTIDVREVFTVSYGDSDNYLSFEAKASLIRKDYEIKNPSGMLVWEGIHYGEAMPEGQYCVIENTGKNTVVIPQPTAEYYDVEQLGTVTLAAGERVQYFVKPKADLSIGEYHENIWIRPETEGCEAYPVNCFFAIYPPLASDQTPVQMEEGWPPLETAVEGYWIQEYGYQILTNISQETVTIEQLGFVYKNAFEVGKPGKTTLAPGETTSFALYNKSGLSAGDYGDELYVIMNAGGERYVLQKQFTFVVTQAPEEEKFDPSWLLIETDELDFGQVDESLGRTTKELRVTNTSQDQSCNIHISGGAAFFCWYCENDEEHKTLAPGETVDYKVIFDPELAEQQNEESWLYVRYGSADDEFVKVLAKAEVLSPEAEIRVKFGLVASSQTVYTQGQEPEKVYVSVSNSGQKAVVIPQPVTTYMNSAQVGTITLAPGQEVWYEMQPRQDLSAGDYVETILVQPSTVGCQSKSLEYRFTVVEGKFALKIEPAQVDFGQIQELPVNQVPHMAEKTFAITNSGTAAGDIYSVFDAKYDIRMSDTHLEPGESITVACKPSKYFAPGKHSEVVTFNGSDGVSASVTMQLEVLPGDGGSFYATPVAVRFEHVYGHYTQMEKQQVTLVNASGQSVELKQPSASYHDITMPEKTLLAPGESAILTVSPRSGLAIGSYQETVSVYDVNNQLLTTFELEHHRFAAGHSVTFQQGEGYTISSSDVSIFQDNVVVHGGSYPIRVTIHDHYTTSEDYVVKANGKPINPDLNGQLAVVDVTEDTVITVEGVVQRPFTYPRDITEAEGNMLMAKLNNANDDLFGDLLVREEEQKIDNEGAEYVVWLQVDDATYTTTVNEKFLIDTVIEDGVITHYLDIRLFKRIGKGNDAIEEITEPGGNVSITLQIPEGHRDAPELYYRHFGIIRLHDGVAEKLYGSYDPQTGLLTFKTDGFSTYAVYYDELMAPPIPQTGDDAPVLLWAMMFITALGAAAFMGSKRFKMQ